MRIGIIGCGKITQVRHAPECAANSHIEIAGFYDRILERANEMAEKYGGKAYLNYKEMLNDETVDGIIVCTANATHAEISMEALRVGKHTLCEKPVAVSVDEAQRIATAAAESGKIFMVAQNQRFDRVNQKAKALLHSGALGEIISFRTEFSHGGPEQWSIDAGNTMYFRKEENFIGAIGDLGIHKIDLMRWMLEDEFTEVSANIRTLQKKDSSGRLIEVEDNAVIMANTQKGYMGTVTASWTNYGHCESSAAVFGTEGAMYISDSVTDSTILIERPDGGRERYQFPKQPNSGVVDEFESAVRMGTASPVSGEDGVRGLKVVMAALQSSSENGKFVKIIY